MEECHQTNLTVSKQEEHRRKGFILTASSCIGNYLLSSQTSNQPERGKLPQGSQTKQAQLLHHKYGFWFQKK